MMIDAYVASFITMFFLDPYAVSKRWQLVKLIVFFLTHYILNPDNPPFSMKNYVALLICLVGNIENLNNLVSEYEWFVFVSDTFEVHGSDAVPVDLHLWEMDPTTPKQGDLEKDIFELPNLIYKPIVGAPQPIGTKCIYADTAVLVSALYILSLRI